MGRILVLLAFVSFSCEFTKLPYLQLCIYQHESIFSLKVRARIQKMGAYAPMNIFLKQEIDRMQRVISTVRQTLTDLKLAIDGTIIMNETLRDALDCMFDARIPESWKRVFTCFLRYCYCSATTV